MEMRKFLIISLILLFQGCKEQSIKSYENYNEEDFVEVQGLTVTQSGESRKDFRLQDTTGQYVECSALGRHAENNNLVEGNEVILYFLTALAGLRGRPGLLWLYDDSHVAMVRKHIVTVPLRQVCALAI